MQKLTDFFNKLIAWYKSCNQEIKEILNLIIYFIVLVSSAIFGILTFYYFHQAKDNLTTLKFNYYILNTLGSLISFVFCYIYLELKDKKENGKQI